MLKDRVALVTGASRGIGAATAALLGENGCKVGVNYHANSEAADRVVSQINGNGGKALAVQADVRNPEQVKQMVASLTEKFGPIDILVLNAGMSVPLKPFHELTYDEFTTKTTGEIDCFIRTLSEVVPQMIAQKRGSIVGVSSTLSRTPAPAFSSHTTAKSGVDGLMKSLALELGPFGIRVNTIAPGFTQTDATKFMPEDRVKMMEQMTPLRRVAQPEDIAGVILSVVSDQMKFVTGSYIPVSGGAFMP